MRPAAKPARLASIVCAVLAAGAARTAPPDPYLELVAGYRHRDPSAVGRAAALLPEQLNALPERLAPSDPRAADLLAASLLHLDACEHLLRAHRTDAAWAHLNTGERFLDAAIARSPQSLGFALRWYAAAGVIADAYEAPVWSDELRSRREARYPPTPARKESAEGLRLELLGVTEGPLSRSDPRWLGLRDPVAVRWFHTAAERFAQAEYLDPALLEAALHQGRALMLAGEPARAALPLERATRSDDMPVRYLAWMFLGALAESDSRFEVAESHYRSAAAAAPFAQSAPLALAHLLTRLGRTADARVLLADHFARTRQGVAEPLWTYLGPPGDHLRESLQNLRAEVWQ